MTSCDIKRILEKKHKDDFFLCEVKTTATVRGLGIVDAFAMKKSWAHPCITIYEIKVNRNDFLNDNKWMKYLPFCNEFYFICPKDLIKENEIPKDVGLRYISGSRVKTIKKAPYRSSSIDNDIFRYILMNRIDNDRYPFHRDKAHYLQDFIDHKITFHQLGEKVSREIAEQLKDMEWEIKRFEEKAKNFDKIIEVLEKYGIITYFSPVSFEEKIEKIITGELKVGIRKEMDVFLRQTIENAQRLIKYLKVEDGDK